MKHLDTRRHLSDNEIGEIYDELTKQRTEAAEETNVRDAAVARMKTIGWNGRLGGIKRATDRDDIPKPFSGCADTRIRWADLGINWMVSLIGQALSNAEINVLCDDPAQSELARILTKLARWCVVRQKDTWGSQIELALRYALTDTPCLSAIACDWESLPMLEPRTLSREKAVPALMQGMEEEDPEALANALASGVLAEDPRAQGIISTLAGVDGETASKILLALGEDDAVRYLTVTGMREGPVIRGLRYYDHFILPPRCSDFAAAPVWFRSEWLTEAQIRNRAASEDWSSAFVARATADEADGMEWIQFGSGTGSSDEFRGRYQIVTCYISRQGPGGSLTHTRIVLCHDRTVTAFGEEILPAFAGGWPVVLMHREQIGTYVTEGRGLAELCSPEQETAKELSDAVANNALIGALPPILARNYRDKVSLRSLGIVRLHGTTSEVKYLQPPAYPAQANNEIQRIRDGVMEYLGMPFKDADPETLAIRRKHTVQHWMGLLESVIGTLVAVTQAYASDALLAEILGADAQVPGIREGFRNGVHLSLRVDIEDLVVDNVIKKTQALGQILGPLDRNRSIPTDAIVHEATRMLFPGVPLPEDASATDADKELREEEENYLRIRGGLRPQMDTDGRWNYPIRLQFWQNLMQTNPAALQTMDPQSQEFAQQWIQALQMQAQQFGPNAELGKTGSPEVQPLA